VYAKASEKVKDAYADAKEDFAEAKDKAKEVYAKASEKVKDAYADAKEDFVEAKDLAKSKIQELKDKKA
jgi:vacuolar-type H+-ATPase subunit H